MPVTPAQVELLEQGPRDCAPSGLFAGAARADISPPLGIAQMNWGAATHIESIGIDSAGLFATAIALSNGGKTQVIVSVDLADVAEEFARPVIERAATLTGVDPDHILLNASHTHSGARARAGQGPSGEDLTQYREVVERYKAQVADKIVGAIVAAYRSRQPAHIHGGRGAGTINISRRFRAGAHGPAAVGRNPEGFVDRELVVFRVDDARGTPLAILVNFQAHPTVLGYANKVISPDFIGAMRSTIESAFPGSLCLFLQGAAGDQGPVEGFSGDLGVAHRLGRILGHQAAAVAEQIDTVRREPTFEGYVESTARQAKQPWRVRGARAATLGFLAMRIDVPRRQYSAEEVAALAANLQRAQEELARAETCADESAQRQAAICTQRYGALLNLWNRAPKLPTIQVELQALRIGALAVVAIAAQPFAAIGAAIKSQSPFAYTMFVAFADGAYDGSMPGAYMPTRSEYEHGGYEVEVTPYGPGADQAVIEAALGMLQRLKQAE
jgi:hypothetical protein